MPEVFATFTEEARDVLRRAHAHATRLGQPAIGTEHLLLALVEVENGTGVSLLRLVGAPPLAVRDAVIAALGEPAATAPAGPVSLTPATQRALRFAVEEAQRLGHPEGEAALGLGPGEVGPEYLLLRPGSVGPEHLLLGLVRTGEGVAAAVLGRFEVTTQRCRRLVLQLHVSMVTHRVP